MLLADASRQFWADSLLWSALNVGPTHDAGQLLRNITLALLSNSVVEFIGPFLIYTAFYLMSPLGLSQYFSTSGTVAFMNTSSIRCNIMWP
jgi:hypothetical protein